MQKCPFTTVIVTAAVESGKEMLTESTAAPDNSKLSSVYSPALPASTCHVNKVHCSQCILVMISNNCSINFTILQIDKKFIRNIFESNCYVD